MNGNSIELQATVTHSSEISPPPYMVGAAEIEVDTETGEVTLLDYAAAVDCGTPINPNLTRVQAEGGIAQGIGMTLTESVTYDDRGYPMENSLFQYKIPARVDIGKIRVEFENSYEGEGPFGAKSIGEVVINTPLPAISDAIRNAVGKRFYELPITPEKIAMAAMEQKVSAKKNVSDRIRSFSLPQMSKSVGRDDSARRCNGLQMVYTACRGRHALRQTH